MHWDIFCRVIDNHGDLGVSWRLARGLAAAGHQVRLWVDDPSALGWMAPACGDVDALVATGSANTLAAPGITLRRWHMPAGSHPAAVDPTDNAIPGDVVVEAFGCDPPAPFVARMAAMAQAPLWLNLEYLSAEPYATRCHGLASPQWHGPGAGLTKWFYYPGFGPHTGGLLHGDLAEAAAAAQPARPAPAPASGATTAPAARQVLLFCYDNPQLPGLLQALADAGPAELWVPPGAAQTRLAGGVGPTAAPYASSASSASSASAAATRATGAHGAGGASASAATARSARPMAWPGLRWHPQPLLAQAAFDALLARMDLNIVRGEDSFVRAQLASNSPWLWQIYPQHDGAHAAKLEAFLALYLADAPTTLAGPLGQSFRAFNGLAPWPARLPPAADWYAHQAGWRAGQLAQTSLLTRLLQFVNAKRQHLPSPD